MNDFKENVILDHWYRSSVFPFRFKMLKTKQNRTGIQQEQ